MPGLDQYADRTALITGASSGIGAAMALELSRRGMKVALLARRHERLQELADEIASAGGQARVEVCDVGEPSQIQAAARSVLNAWGGVDLLVNNAGFGRHILFADHDLNEIERMMRVNYLGSVAWIKALLPGMLERGAGWIVNISSFAGLIPQPDEAAYSASKFALSALSEALGHELRPRGIHVMAVHPVLVRTEMFTPEVMARLPARSEGTFIDAPEFVAETLRALERGETSIVVPRRYRLAHWLWKLFPKRVGGAMARMKLRVLPDWPTPTEN